MRQRRLIYFILMLSAFILQGCNASKLMYDISQKDRLYFTMQETPGVASFALISDDEIIYEAPVNMMGMPKNYNRNVKLRFISDKEDSVFLGKAKVAVAAAQENADYEFNGLEIPAGKVEGTLKLKLKRTEKMKEKYVSIRFRVEEDAEFMPMDADSSNIKRILTPEFHIYVNAGEPVCPSWWDASTSSSNLFGWHMFLGNFYPDKFRKLLDLYHAMKTKNPVIYQQCVDKYGENLDNEGIEAAFFQKENPAIWATYVLIPLYNYYKEYYQNHPDDPNLETMQDKGAAGKYWKNPLGQLK